VTGYTYTPEALRDLVKEWADLALDYHEAVAKARPMVEVQEPGKDLPSAGHTSVAVDNGSGYLQSLMEKHRFCASQSDKLRRTLGEYLRAEYGHAENFQKILEYYLGHDQPRTAERPMGSAPQAGV
jgi:hypothetical protein